MQAGLSGRGWTLFAIIGILVVFGAVIGGYLMEKGHIAVLLQPAELLIIGGAALGTLLIANPVHILKELFAGLKSVFGHSKFNKSRYLDTLKMMYEIFNKVRREGMLAIEGDIEQPQESKVFQQFPAFLADHRVRAFVCDTMRMSITGGVDPFDIDQMMELDMDVQHHDANECVSALNSVADALPGLGIVAAVLGVVITMGALGGPPEFIGHKVAAALVGTFLGILLCYGLVGPIGANLGKTAEDERAYLHVLRVLLLCFAKNLPPIIAVEVGRRAVPSHVRPSFAEMEAACKAPQSGAVDTKEAAA